jgi:hypothetical protein
MFRSGNKFVSLTNRTANVLGDRGDYFLFNSTTNYAVLEFLDQYHVPC